MPTYPAARCSSPPVSQHAYLSGCALQFPSTAPSPGVVSQHAAVPPLPIRLRVAVPLHSPGVVRQHAAIPSVFAWVNTPARVAVSSVSGAACARPIHPRHRAAAVRARGASVTVRAVCMTARLSAMCNHLAPHTTHAKCTQTARVAGQVAAPTHRAVAGVGCTNGCPTT